MINDYIKSTQLAPLYSVYNNRSYNLVEILKLNRLPVKRFGIA